MMLYISQKYQSTITLDEIAASANVSKSMCNKIFHKYLSYMSETFKKFFEASPRDYKKAVEA